MDTHNGDDEDYQPVRRMPKRLAQVIVSIAIAALVLPGFVVTWTTQVRTAAYACDIAVAYYAPGATGSQARFSLADVSLPGWNCYAVMFNSDELFVAHLGIVPGAPRLVPLTGS
jgi:uncharacterized protein YqjF (DUF2071 family)